MPINPVTGKANSHTNRSVKPNSVAIDMSAEDLALQCIDDNFCIEVILAAFDFFRVSETKQD